MMLKYKLDGRNVRREEVLSSFPSPDLVKKWEDAVSKYAEEITSKDISVILHLTGNEVKAVTETSMLMKLHLEVYKNMYNQKIKEVAN